MFSHGVTLPPKHKIKATKCLAKRPPPPVDKRAYTGPHLCRECMAVQSTCGVCGRCDQHCVVGKPGDRPAHEPWFNQSLPAGRKRKR